MRATGETPAPTPTLLDYAGPTTALPVRGVPTVLEWSIVIGVILLLVALLVSGLDAQRTGSTRVACAANLRSVGQALQLYASDHGGAFPDTLEPIVSAGYVRDVRVLLCPACEDTPAPRPTPTTQAADLTAGGHLSYVYTGRGLTTGAAADTVIAYENLTNHDDEDGKRTGGNVVFFDGHAEWFNATQLRRLSDRFAAGERPVVWRTAVSNGAATKPAPTTQPAPPAEPNGCHTVPSNYVRARSRPASGAATPEALRIKRAPYQM